MQLVVRSSRRFNRYIFPIFAIAAVSCAFIFLLKRLFYGVDLTDESYYSAQAMAFSRGFRPYLDETMVHQSFAILLQPITSIWLRLHGSAEGIVVAFRLVYFFSLLFGCILAFRSLKRFIPSPEAAMTCLLIFCFWPFAIPSLSYNTIGSLLFNIGVLLLLEQSEKNRISFCFPISLILFATAAFCYPTWLVPILFSLIVFLLFVRKKGTDKAVWLSSGLVVFVCLALFVYLIFFHIGLNRVSEIYHYTSSHNLQGGGLKKIVKIFGQIKQDFNFFLVLIGGVWLSCLLARRSLYAAIFIAVLMFVGLFKYPLQDLSMPSFHEVLTSLIFIALPMALVSFFKRDLKIWKVLSIIACVAGLVCSWTSGNGFANFSIGASIGLLPFGAYLSDSFKKYGNSGRVVTLSMLSIFVFYMARAQYLSVSGDDYRLDHLNTEILEGPFKGLKTTPEKAEFLKQFSEDLGSAVSQAKSVAFLESFMYGYLFTDLKIKSPAVWVYSLNQFRYDRDMVTRFYNDFSARPDVIFWQKSIPVSNEFTYLLKHDLPDSLKEMVLAHYETVVSRAHYTIYRKIK